MGDNIKATLTSKIKLPQKHEPFWVKVLGFIVIPIVLLFSIAFLALLVIAGIVKNVVNIFQKPKIVVSPMPIASAYTDWHTFLGNGPVKLWQRYKGEVHFGPWYSELKSEPQIEYLTGKTFGDWCFPVDNGWLLQEWNSTRTPDTNLVYMNTETLEVKVILQNIPAVLWEITTKPDETLQLSCNTGKEILLYQLEI